MILSKQLPSFFCLKDGFFRKPTSPPLPLMRDFFLKSPRPSLPLKRAPPLISVFSPQGRRGNRSSSSLVTISFYGWRTIRGLASSRAAVCGMRPHGQRRTKWLQKAQKANSSTPLWPRSPQQHALKGQKLLAQGNALGFNDIQANAL